MFEESRSNAFHAEVQTRDLRAVEREMYVKWINLFNDNKECKIKFLKNRTRHAIIGEAWPLNNRYDMSVKKNLKKNLKFFKKQKYDSVLVRFDCTEDLNMLMQLIDDIKSEGFNVYATYTGKDGMKPCWSPFIDPDILETYI